MKKETTTNTDKVISLAGKNVDAWISIIKYQRRKNDASYINESFSDLRKAVLLLVELTVDSEDVKYDLMKVYDSCHLAAVARINGHNDLAASHLRMARMRVIFDIAPYSEKLASVCDSYINKFVSATFF